MNPKRATAYVAAIVVVGLLTYLAYQRWCGGIGATATAATINITLNHDGTCTPSIWKPHLAAHPPGDSTTWQPGAGMSSGAYIHFIDKTPFDTKDVQFGKTKYVINVCFTPNFVCHYVVDGCNGYQQEIGVHVSH